MKGLGFGLIAFICVVGCEREDSRLGNGGSGSVINTVPDGGESVEPTTDADIGDTGDTGVDSAGLCGDEIPLGTCYCHISSARTSAVANCDALCNACDV